MFGSCYFDRTSNVEISTECQIFVLLSLLTTTKFYNLGHIQGIMRLHQLKKKSFLVNCTTFSSAFHVGWKNQSKHSTLNSPFDALSKWHEPDINYALSFDSRYHSRFFVQVEHETTYASSGNNIFFTKSCHCQTLCEASR